MEISNLDKLVTSSGADSNENSTSVFRLKSQGLTVPRIYGVNDHSAEVEVPRIFNSFTEAQDMF